MPFEIREKRRHLFIAVQVVLLNLQLRRIAGGLFFSHSLSFSFALLLPAIQQGRSIYKEKNKYFFFLPSFNITHGNFFHIFIYFLITRACSLWGFWIHKLDLRLSRPRAHSWDHNLFSFSRLVQNFSEAGFFFSIRKRASWIFVY